MTATRIPMPSRRLLAALLLPLVGLIGGAAVAWWQTSHGSVWEVPIRGYDPRDLLRGHYIRFQYDWATPARPAAVDPEHWRLCFRHRGAATVVTLFASTDRTPEACQAIARQIRGHDGLVMDYGGQGRGQFYLDETDARPLEQLLTDPARKVSARVIVTASGRLTPLDILVDGKPYREVLAATAKPPSQPPASQP